MTYLLTLDIIKAVEEIVNESVGFLTNVKKRFAFTG